MVHQTTASGVPAGHAEQAPDDQLAMSRGLRHKQRQPRVDFDAIKATALRALPALLTRWLPDGKVRGYEWVVRNPRRSDTNPGSFSINLRSGRWADFATGDKGGDVISLAAYLHGLSQIDAARQLAHLLGLEGGANG
jgi:hypothetical protein